MADSLSKTKRSALMSRVKGKDTMPEKITRSIIHKLGFRFRLHKRDLPGKPDIVLPRHNAIIFVHGCFWHQHPNCTRAKRPSTRREFWDAKLDRNIQRDIQNVKKLEELGWKVMVIWECETGDQSQLASTISHFLYTSN